MLAEGVLLTVLIIAGNTLLRPLVNAINRIPINEAATEATYEVRLSVDADAVPRVRERLVDALEAAQYPVGDVQVVEHADAPTDVIAVLVSTAVSADELDVVLARMEHVPGVLHATWEVPAHPLQLGDLPLQHIGLCQQRLTVQRDTSMLRRQRQPDLLQRQPGRLAKTDQRQPFQHALVVLPAQAATTQCLQQPKLFVVAQGRGRHATALDHLADIKFTHGLDLK
ncbi:hypothetical protein Ddc_22609 [Ditylenchus destructor]|nr:hypothetical protein Ddc_22609 [Ditylenchus destructor]